MCISIWYAGTFVLLILFQRCSQRGAYYKASRDPKIYSASATILLRPNDPNEQLASGKLEYRRGAGTQDRRTGTCRNRGAVPM